MSYSDSQQNFKYLNEIASFLDFNIFTISTAHKGPDLFLAITLSRKDFFRYSKENVNQNSTIRSPSNKNLKKTFLSTIDPHKLLVGALSTKGLIIILLKLLPSD